MLDCSSTNASILVSRVQQKVGDAILGIPCVKNTYYDSYAGGKDKDTLDEHLRQMFHQLHEGGCR